MPSSYRHKILDILRRVIILLLVVWTVVSLVTLLIEFVPGDPAVAILGEQATPEMLEQFRQKHGLDRPAFFFTFPQDADGTRHFQWHGWDNRYIDYWRELLRGDMGRSFRTDRPVRELIAQRYPFTIDLAICALFVAVAIAIPFGVISGKNRGRLLDNGISVIALVGISLPGFVLGPMLIFLLAVKASIFPVSGTGGAIVIPFFQLAGQLIASPFTNAEAGQILSQFGLFFRTLPTRIEHLVLPAFTLGLALSAILTRMVRSSVIEELGEDYVRTARAKGLSESKVVYKHVLKNGLIPVVTILGLQLGVLLAGAIITEKIFGWPGIGLLLVEEGIAKRDYRLVQGCVLVISVTYIFANTLTDIIYRWLDPRIRVS